MILLALDPYWALIRSSAMRAPVTMSVLALGLLVATTGCSSDQEATPIAPSTSVAPSSSDVPPLTTSMPVTSSPAPTTSTPTPTPTPTDPYAQYRGQEGFVTSADFPEHGYGRAWPLTVDAGFLGCPQSFGAGAGAVTFKTLDGTEYALNGQAAHDYPSINPILKKGAISIPLIDAGLKLC